MSVAQHDCFHRLLEILLPAGGALMVMHEAYFDESRDFEEAPHISCVAGYYIDSASAKVLDTAWLAILNKYQIPYFHMVDCAHGVPPFDKLSEDERIDIVKALIALIKQHTIQGLSILGKREYFYPSDEQPDIYTTSVGLCVDAVERFLDANRIKGPIAYFFESGHAKETTARRAVAERIKEISASLTFGRKDQIRLLQAADLLAWQSAKYVKDQITGERGPRKDFLSLMEHDHTLSYISVDGESKSITFELFPLNRRSKKTVQLNPIEGGDFFSFTEDADPVPITPIKTIAGFKEGGGKMVYIGFEDFKECKFGLAFDEMRLFEALGIFARATEVYGHTGIKFLPHGFSLERVGDHFEISFHLVPAGKISFAIDRQSLPKLMDEIRRVRDSD